MTSTQEIAVEKLQGDEQTDYGTVAYIICEPDGVDVIFYEGNVHHFNYDETITVTIP